VSDGFEYLNHYSFFVVSVSERWFLVSAGHVLSALDDLFRNADVRILSAFLADFFGERGVRNVPLAFAYESTSRFFLDDKGSGVDFGFIPVSDRLKADLRVSKIEPISERHWTRETDPEIAAYWLLGFPADINQQYNQPIRAGDERRGVAAPVMVSADRLEPHDVHPDIADWQTPIPRFIGRINLEIPFRIEGMSGGPIFGLCETHTGHVGYTVVALQSCWEPTTRTIFGCPIRVFGEVLMHHLEGQHPGG
jgi:hypothetical protein